MWQGRGTEAPRLTRVSLARQTMIERQRYLATLRCRTWHSWPGNLRVVASGFQLQLDDDAQVNARVTVASYLPRSVAHDYSAERADVGPLVWRGDVPGLYSVRDRLLKAPEDVVQVTLDHEPPRRGEIDILIGLQPPASPRTREGGSRGVQMKDTAFHESPRDQALHAQPRRGAA